MCMRTLYHFPRTILSYKTLMTQYPVHQMASTLLAHLMNFWLIYCHQLFTKWNLWNQEIWWPWGVHQCPSTDHVFMKKICLPTMEFGGFWWTDVMSMEVHQRCYLGWCHLMNFDEKSLVRIESRGHERRVPRTFFL